MSAPFKASRPVWDRYSLAMPLPIMGEYILAKMSRAWDRWSSPSIPVNTP